VATIGPRATDEEQAFALAAEMGALLDGLETPAAKRITHLPEQLSFLSMRENFRVAVQLFEAGDDVSAALLVRAIFEESIRWAWVDEERDVRRLSFIAEARHAHGLIAEAATKQGLEANEYFGPMVEAILEGEIDADRFPKIEQMLNWATPDLKEMLYLQYRVLSQYTHSSLLAAVNTLPAAWGARVHVRRLPRFTRLTILRNGAASAAMVTVHCKAGLYDPTDVSQRFDLHAMHLAAAIAELLEHAAPGSA